MTLQGETSMAIELRYRDNGKGVLFVCTGVVTSTDFDQANREVYSEERLRILRYQVIDFSDTEHIDLSVDDTRRHAAMDESAAKLNPELVIAVVCPSDLSFGISRMWQVFIGEGKIESSIFRTISEAERWIAETMNDSRP